MKLLKYLFILIGILLLLLMAVALILPKEYTFKANKNVNVPVEFMSYLSGDLEQLSQMMANSSSAMAKTRFRLGDKKQGEGATIFWGPKEGGGRMEVSSIQPNYQTTYDLQLHKRAKANMEWNFSEENDGTRLDAKLTTKVKVPYNILMYFQGQGGSEILSLLLDEMSSECEEIMKTGIEIDGFKLSFQNFDKKRLYGSEKNITQGDASDIIKSSFASILRNTDVNTETKNYALYYEWNEENATTRSIMASDMPELKNKSNLETIDIPAHKTVSTTFKGNYKDISKAHAAINQLIEKMGVKPIAPVIEEFQSDPRNIDQFSENIVRVYYLYILA